MRLGRSTVQVLNDAAPQQRCAPHTFCNQAARPCASGHRRQLRAHQLRKDAVLRHQRREIAALGDAALKLTASALMSRNVISCTPEDTVAKAMEIMTARRFRHLPVVDHGNLVGMISIGDVVKERIGEAEQEAEQLRAFVAGQA